MIKIAVCNNDKNVSEQITKSLSGFQVKYSLDHLIFNFSSPDELCQSDMLFDMIFFDPDPYGVDGLRMAAKIRLKNRKSAIVYISGRLDCIIKIFAVHPFDFIEKPVATERIYKVIKDFYLYYVEQKKKNSVVEFQGVTGPLMLDTNDIYVFEYTGNRRITIFTEERKYIIRGGIVRIIEMIDMKRFSSPHKSFIINMEYVKGITDYMIYMTNNISVPVAQKKLKKFKNELSLYFSGSEGCESVI